jgi:hypothetical protein
MVIIVKEYTMTEQLGPSPENASQDLDPFTLRWRELSEQITEVTPTEQQLEAARISLTADIEDPNSSNPPTILRSISGILSDPERLKTYAAHRARYAHILGIMASEGLEMTDPEA